MTNTLFISTDDINGLAEPKDYVAAVRAGYRQVGIGAPVSPTMTIAADEHEDVLTSYLAMLPDTGVMGGYTYSSGFESGDAWFVTPLFSTETGEPLAIVDGTYLNPFKTGAVGAVGIDALARSDVENLAIIGSGRQARAQLVLAMTVRGFQTVRVYSPTESNRTAFANEMNSIVDAEVIAVESSDAAVDDADVVITATNASEPVFDGRKLADGAHVTAMGQHVADKRELDATTIERSVYVPDLRDRALSHAGSFLQAIDAGRIDESHLHAELGEVIVGKKPGRTASSDITVFDSGGTAVETVAAAGMVYERARKAGLGQPIHLTAASESTPSFLG